MAKPNPQDVSYDDIAGVRITNPDGSSYTMPYSAAQKSGLVSSGEDLASTENRTAYTTATGGYTTDYSKAYFPTSISLNKDTGNVKIDAPSIYFKTENYQQKVKPVLESISQNYKLNPEYKYALLNGDEDTKTSEDWLREIEKELPQLTKETLVNQKVKDTVKEQTGLDLTDDQLIKMSSVAIEKQQNGQVIKVTDDTIQSLPERIKNLAAFKNLQGWQNGEVTYKNLMESWNRENTSDDDLLQVFNEVENYFNEGKFDDADEYAEMVAFSQFIEDKHPETGFWRGAWDGITNAFVGLVTGAAQFDVDVMSIAEGIRNNIAPDYKGPISGTNNFVRDYLQPELDSWVDNFQTNSMRLNEAAGTVGAMLHEITPLAMQIAVGNALGKAAAAGVGNVASKLIAGMDEARFVGTAGVAGATMTAEEVAKSALNGTNFLMRVMSSNKANGLIASAVGTLKAAQTMSSVAMTTADLAAQIIVDVAVQDSKLTRQLLDGNVSNEVKEYVLEQIALDAGGWAVATGAIKAVKGIGKTDFGRVVNAAVVPKVNKWTSKIGEYTDTIKTNVFHRGDINWNQTKADRLRSVLEAESPEGWRRNRLENKIGAAERRQQNLSVRRAERLGRAKVGALPGVTEGATSWGDIVENANRIKRESDIYFTAAHGLANRVYKGDVSARVSRITVDVPTLNVALDEYTSQLTKALRAEDAAGLKRSTKAFEVGRGRTLSGLSKESNEYIIGSYRSRLGEATKQEFLKEGRSIKGVQQEIDYYTEATRKFREKYPELANQLDDLLAKGKNLSAATQDARVYEKVLDQDLLDQRRNSPYFKDGYLRTQRVQEWEEYQRGGELKIGKIRDDQHLRWGFEGDAPAEYQDITFVLFDDVNQVAKQSIRREEIGYLRDLGEKVEVTVDGEKVYRAKEAHYTKTKAIEGIEQTTKNVVRDMDSSIFNKVFEFKESKSTIMTAEAAAMKEGAKVSRARVTTAPVSDRKIKAMINSVDYGFTDDLISELVEDELGKPLSQLTEQEWDSFIEKASPRTKKVLSDKLQGSNILETEYGDLTKVQLPKIKTSTYSAATGLKYKDAPSWLKPYLSEKNGIPMDEVLTMVGDSGYDFMVNQERVGNAWEQVEDIYQRVLDRDSSRGVSYASWENFLRSGGITDIDDINRAIVMDNYNNMWDANGKAIRALAEAAEQDKAIFDAETLYAENIKRLEEIRAEINLPNMAVDLNREMDEIIDGFIATNRSNVKVMEGLNTLGDGEDIVEYATLKSLTNKDNLKETTRKLYSAANDEYNKILTANNEVTKDGKTVKKLTKGQLTKAAGQWADQTVAWYEERVNQRFAEAVNRLKDIDPEIIDYDDLFGKIEAINDEITTAAKSTDIVKTYDDIGREEYVRLSPTVANMITTMPTPLRRGAFGEIQQEFVKVFRMGTTGGMVPASLIRQWFRDTGLAVTTANVTRTSAEVEAQLTKVYGATIADYYQKNMPDLWQTLLTKAESTGEDVERLAAQTEMLRGRTFVPDELQSEMYRFRREQRIARNQDGVYDKRVIDGIKYKLEDVMSKTEKLNNMRETNRRVWAYNNAYIDALNNGHSIPMARRYAEMIQAEATTNFSRQTYHLANLTHTVPYLGSAINGQKSFWRLMSIDPVGITTRIVGGYLVPMIALTNMSLGTEENRNVYKQIPEYEKDDNLIFVLNGQKFSIPIPQEISSLLRPIQSWIETMQGANDHSFEELMANNLAGMFPYELQGFVNIDSDRILANNEQGDIWNDHMLPGFSMMASQMMPPLVKTGVMLATGYDPYTRKLINTSYNTTDPITGEALVVDYKSGELAKALGSLFGGNFGVSAPMAQAIFNNLLGSGNMMIIDGLSEIAASIPTDQGIGAGLTRAAERLGESATKPLVIQDYGELSNQAWNRAVAQLYREKEDILNDKQYQADLKSLAEGGLTQDAENKIKSRISTKREEFQEKVLRATQNLDKEYQGTMDRNKFASVLSLMTFYDGTNQDPTNPLSNQYNKESYNLARAQAIETMVQMGFTSPNDYSMFGYYGVDKNTGEISVQLYSPLAILNYERSSGLQSDIALANIKESVKSEGLWDVHELVKEQINKIYDSKKKLTKNDYANIEAIQINWNAQVAKTLAPYLSKMTPEAALNNNDVLNYLYSLIEVPSSWEVDKRGKRVSLGDRANKKKAYYDSWIKSMFSVNDPYKGQY